MKTTTIRPFLAAAAVVLMTSCATAGDYATLTPGEIQLAGHPFKTARDCPRKAPIGKFDNRCDIPLLGYRGANGDVIVPQVGAPGGFGLGM